MCAWVQCPARRAYREQESRFSPFFGSDPSSVSYWDPYKSNVWAKHNKLPGTLQVMLESVSPSGARRLYSPGDGNRGLQPASHVPGDLSSG